MFPRTLLNSSKHNTDKTASASTTLLFLFHHLSPSLSPSYMLSFPSLCLCPTLSLSLSVLTTLSLFLVFLMAEYPLIPNPDADFRFVRPARSCIGFSHQCLLFHTLIFSALTSNLPSPTSLKTHVLYDIYIIIITVYIKCTVCITSYTLHVYLPFCPFHYLFSLFVSFLSLFIYHK